MMGRLLLFLYGMSASITGSMILYHAPKENKKWVLTMIVLGIAASVFSYTFAEFKDTRKERKALERAKKAGKVTPIGIYIKNPYDED